MKFIGFPTKSGAPTLMDGSLLFAGSLLKLAQATAHGTRTTRAATMAIATALGFGFFVWLFIMVASNHNVVIIET
jgi:hypothetical protein